ncbi:MAG: hypothetical protein V4760_08455 [Bdellovibrionota bacterium]
MASDAKKTAVKEKFKARPGVGRIMPEKGRELVPVHTQTSIEELPKHTVTRKNVIAASVPQKDRQENTQLTQYGTFQYERPAPDRIKRPAPKRFDRTPWLFLIPAFALIAFVATDDPGSGSLSSSPLSRQSAVRDDEAEHARRAEMHRKMTGWKMNRERVDVQIGNHFAAPAIPYDAVKKKAPDIMVGVPIEGEGHPRSYEASKTKQVSPEFTDTAIAYRLRDEQTAQQADQIIEKQFVDDFIANARREGYELQVKKDGTVVIKRAPSQYRGTAPSSSD